MTDLTSAKILSEPRLRSIVAWAIGGCLFGLREGTVRADDVVLAAEVGTGQTQSGPDVPKSAFFYERVAGRWSPSDGLEVAMTMRATEDLARAPDPGSIYATGGDAVLFGSLDVAYDFAEHWNVLLGVDGSPSSTRRIAIANPFTADERPSTDQDPDALVRANTSSIGAELVLGYDSFDAERSHAVDVAIDASAALTRFFTEQTMTNGAFTASQFGTRSASLGQTRLGVTGTTTLFDHTDLGLDAAYFVYDSGDPGSIGVFTEASASNLQTTFGAGLPMLPARFTLRPEVGERIAHRLSLRAYYQYADLAIDGGTGHTVGGKVQLAIENVKVFVTGNYRVDVFGTDSAQTWSLGAGFAVRF